MVKITKNNDSFTFKVNGLHKILTFKSQLEIPIKNVIKAYKNEDDFGFFKGIKFPGINVPGLITAGSFLTNSGMLFYDITDSKNCIIVELKDETYNKLIIEVENIEEAIELINQKNPE